MKNLILNKINNTEKSKTLINEKFLLKLDDLSFIKPAGIDASIDKFRFIETPRCPRRLRRPFKLIKGV